MTAEIDVNHAPLPGYRLTARLGAGGYGEVWRAEAPGGLTKAIKFVFGQQHEKRATRELRALELIKQLRHPFLLSLERIEIVDGRLLIVTELADCSIKDRFDACRRENKPGIPRDELLRYLRDAADALDYMAESHGLQHLDIKPENLLLLASHVKVADFGLVKDMKQTEASLVGGMTPLYAAPEVFRGRPSRQSDQYSLAIVYMEMLSGALPFVGGNAAELTLQHLNEEPNLSSLTGADTYVVSRALSKEPGHRYATCLDFVEALAGAAVDSGPFSANHGSEPNKQTPVWPSDSRLPTNSPTELFDDDDTASCRDSLLIDLPTVAPSVTNLPQLEVGGKAFCASPALFVGIGGAACRVLQHLRQGIRDQYGDRPLPAVQMLLIDSDPKALADATSGERGLTTEEILNVPLRRPQHYRDRWDQLLRWLSRRWLYNIPKSMRTEGLRPLGRLAFVDHARQTCQRIRKSLAQAMDQQSVAQSSNFTGQEFRGDTARIYIVASISGGTGSGMVLDVAYAMRTMLAKMNLSHADVFGIMLHSTGRDPRHCELARVNAYSWLTEFHHFHQPDSQYPGDASCGLPPHAAGVAAFDHSYLVHLGDGADESEFEQATQAVADYLRLDALSPAQTTLDAGRRQPVTANAVGRAGSALNLRSFGLFRRTSTPNDFADEAAAEICARLIDSWRGPAKAKVESETPAEPLPSPAQALIRRLQLTPTGLTANLRAIVEAQLQTDASGFLSKLFADRTLANQTGEARQLTVVDEMFSRPGQGGDGDGQPWMLGLSLAAIFEPFCETIRGEIRRSVIGQLDDPSQRLAGAQSAVNWMCDHFQSILRDVGRLTHGLAERLVAVRTAHATPSAAGVSPRVLSYFQLRLDQFALRAVEYVCRLGLADLKCIGDELNAFAREVAHMSTAIGNRTKGSGVEGVGPAEFEVQLDDFVTQVDLRIRSEYLAGQGGLFATVMQGGRPRAQLCAKLHQLARDTVRRGLAGKATKESTSAMPPAPGSMTNELSNATPSLLDHGGARRVLAIVPGAIGSADEQQSLAAALGTPVTVSAGGTGGLVLCVEAEQLPLPTIALQLVERRRDRVEFAKRVHSRSDIAWTPLTFAPLNNSTNRPSIAPVVATFDSNLRQTDFV